MTRRYRGTLHFRRGKVRCQKCAAAVVENAPFCHECGAPIVRSVPSSAGETDGLRRLLASALGTQYEILRLLGRGGMGAVYLAQERALDRLVAIKVLPPDASGAPQSRDRFVREAQTAARLTHQSVVPLLTFGENNGLTYYVMGYVEGESLERRLQRLGSMAPEDVRRIMGEVAEALEYAHARGVVHRDIKPDNVLLDDSTGRAILTDFGIAKRRTSAGALTQAGMAVGTPHYMSPEQALGDSEVDGRTDIYALGVMGYRMLSGRLPFEGENIRDLMTRQVMAEPVPLRTIAPDAPADLVSVIARCLQKNPEHRWADGKELRKALMASAIGEEAYPEQAMRLKGTGTLSLVLVGITLLMSTASMLGARSQGEARLIPALVWYPLLGSLIPLAIGHVVQMMRRLGTLGLSSAQAKRLLFWLPDWASGMAPWPLVVRRPGDLWTRVPKPARVASTLVTAAILQVFPLAPMWNRLARTWSESYWTLARQIAEHGYPWWLDAVTASIVPFAALTTLAAAIAVALRWGRSAGLTARETTNVLLAPTQGQSIWSRRRFAELLLPASEGGTLTAMEPQSPPEYLRAIIATADSLTGWQRELGAEAVATARRLIRTLESVDGEMTRLSRDSDPAEVARLGQRLQAIDANAGNASPEQQEMRNLLAGQLNLAHRLAQRLNEAQARWSHLLTLLRSLWMQLADLRARATLQSSRDGGVTGEIRALCADIERRTAAEAETDRLLAGDATALSTETP